jgi:hypothetical protein
MDQGALDLHKCIDLHKCMGGSWQLHPKIDLLG